MISRYNPPCSRQVGFEIISSQGIEVHVNSMQLNELISIVTRLQQKAEPCCYLFISAHFLSKNIPKVLCAHLRTHELTDVHDWQTSRATDREERISHPIRCELGET